MDPFASFLLFLGGIILAIWEPGWMKPTWQRRLEDQYDEDTIKRLIINWRKMDRGEWGRMIETQKGLDELVRRAGVPVATTDLRGRSIERGGIALQAD